MKDDEAIVQLKDELADMNRILAEIKQAGLTAGEPGMLEFVPKPLALHSTTLRLLATTIHLLASLSKRVNALEEAKKQV